MRILMVSPHPVYSPRGTPISVFNRCLALSALGHEIDLVTYPIGEDVPLPGLRYLRPRAALIHSVRVGPSWAKGVLNTAVALRSARELLSTKRRYDVLHTHEEAGLIGLAARALQRLPHIYDMGNGWGVVLQNYGIGARNPLTRAAEALERSVVRSADAVIAHFPAVADQVSSRCSTPVSVAFNIPFERRPSESEVGVVRERWSRDGEPLVVYTGTLEPYQGIDLLLEAMSFVRAPARLVVVGGRSDQIEQLRGRATSLGISNAVEFAGTLPPSSIPGVLGAADVLASPRGSGTNTPLKIFSYLRSGTPIVATRIESHTQVLDDDNSILVEPTASAFAVGIDTALTDVERTRRVIRGASTPPEELTTRGYLRSVASAYERVGGPRADDAALDEAIDRIDAYLSERPVALRERRSRHVPQPRDRRAKNVTAFQPLR